MKVNFKQAVHLDGKNYALGVNEVPEKVLKGAGFHRLIKAGWVGDIDSPPVEVITEQQRQDRLAAKVLATAAKARPVAPPATPTSAPKKAEAPTPAPVEEKDQDEDVNTDEFGEDVSGGADEQNEELPQPVLEEAHYSGKKIKKRK